MAFGDGSKLTDAVPLRSHDDATDYVLKLLVTKSEQSGLESLSDIEAAGHRVVRGGEKLQRLLPITPEVIEQIDDVIELAPLHNPANLKGIHPVTANLGAALPQVAVFDTAFHATMPEVAYLYALPYPLYRRHRIRRYGFHGLSHRYVAMRYRKTLGLAPNEVNVISLHLGNGCSACAIEGGESVDTSMGFTPLEGLIMGTRSGDVDPSILDFLRHKEGLDLDQIDTLLNKQSGLLGISGLTNDMRDLLAEVEYITAGTLVTMPDGETVKAKELSGANGLLFRRNSKTGTIEAIAREGAGWQGLNADLHDN